MKVRTRVAILLALALLLAGASVTLISALTYQHAVYSNPTEFTDAILKNLGVTREQALAYVRVPVMVMQGEADPYGTLAQVRVVEEECTCPVETAVLPGVGHAPHREKPDETLAAIAAFADRIFRAHGEAMDGAA